MFEVKFLFFFRTQQVPLSMDQGTTETLYLSLFILPYPSGRKAKWYPVVNCFPKITMGEWNLPQRNCSEICSRLFFSCGFNCFKAAAVALATAAWQSCERAHACGWQIEIMIGKWPRCEVRDGGGWEGARWGHWCVTLMYGERNYRRFVSVASVGINSWPAERGTLMWQMFPTVTHAPRPWKCITIKPSDFGICGH